MSGVWYPELACLGSYIRLELDTLDHLHTFITPTDTPVALKVVRFRNLPNLSQVTLPSSLKSLSIYKTPIRKFVTVDEEGEIKVASLPGRLFLHIAHSSIFRPTSLPSNLKELHLRGVGNPGLLRFPTDPTNVVPCLPNLTNLAMEDIPLECHHPEGSFLEKRSLLLEKVSQDEKLSRFLEEDLSEAENLTRFLESVCFIDPTSISFPKLKDLAICFPCKKAAGYVSLAPLLNHLEESPDFEALSLVDVTTNPVLEGLPESLKSLSLSCTNIEVIKSFPRGLKSLTITSGDILLPPLPYGLERLYLAIPPYRWESIMIPSTVRDLDVNCFLTELNLPRNYHSTTMIDCNSIEYSGAFEDDEPEVPDPKPELQILLDEYPTMIRSGVYDLLVAERNRQHFSRETIGTKIRLSAIYWRCRYLRAYNIISTLRRKRVDALKAKAKLIAIEIDASLGSKEYHLMEKKYRGIMG
jgi:hypothetical protein